MSEQAENKPKAASEDVDMKDASTAAPAAEAEQVDPEKIVKLPGGSEDGMAATFQIKDEDHTLGNSLRYMIMKNPDVEFCGYSIPHPAENKMNIRIQTYGKMSAVEALQKGLSDLSDMCDHIETVFRQKVSEGNYTTNEE